MAVRDEGKLWRSLFALHEKKKGFSQEDLLDQRLSKEEGLSLSSRIPCHFEQWTEHDIQFSYHPVYKQQDIDAIRTEWARKGAKIERERTVNNPQADEASLSRPSSSQ